MRPETGMKNPNVQRNTHGSASFSLGRFMPLHGIDPQQYLDEVMRRRSWTAQGALLDVANTERDRINFVEVCWGSMPCKRHEATRLKMAAACGIPLHSISRSGRMRIRIPGIRSASERSDGTGLVRRRVGSRVGVSDLAGGAWMSRAG